MILIGKVFLVTLLLLSHEGILASKKKKSASSMKDLDDDTKFEFAKCDVCEKVVTDITKRMVTTPVGETVKGGRIGADKKKDAKKERATKMARANEIVDSTCANKELQPKSMCEDVVESLESKLIDYVFKGEIDKDPNTTFCFNKFCSWKANLKKQIDSMKDPSRFRAQGGFTWKDAFVIAITEYWWVYVVATVVGVVIAFIYQLWVAQQ
eukprot:PhF_6_TR9765/c0_g1_i1/m.15050